VFSIQCFKDHSNALLHSATSAPNSTSITLSHKTSPHIHASNIHASNIHASNIHASTIHLPHEQPTSASIHSIQIITRPTFTFATGTIPSPFHTRPPHSVLPQAQPQQSGQKPIFVVFEVLGGVLASGLLLGLLRCCYQYNKAPQRDRIAEVLNRHNLQRELEELERNPNILRRQSLREPAPPYFPAPPSYEIITSPPITTGAHRTGYTGVDTRNLSSSSMQSPQSQNFIPPRPAG